MQTVGQITSEITVATRDGKNSNLIVFKLLLLLLFGAGSFFHILIEYTFANYESSVRAAEAL